MWRCRSNILSVTVTVSWQWASQCQHWECLVGLGVKASALRAEDLGFNTRLHSGDFSGSSHTQWLKNWHSSGYPARHLMLWDWSTWHQYTVTGWGRIVWSAASVSVWQHVDLSEQIHPWGTPACCWDVKRTTNKPSTNPVMQAPGRAATRGPMLVSLVWLSLGQGLRGGGGGGGLIPNLRLTRQTPYR